MEKQDKRSPWKWHLFTVTAAFLIGIILGHFSGVLLTLYTEEGSFFKEPPPGFCVRPSPILADQWSKPSLFTPLSTQEMQDIYDFIFSENIIGNNTSSHGRHFLRVNTVTHMHLLPPNKRLALQHLDHGEDPPRRFAVAHVIRGDDPDPRVQKYKVGPLGSPDNMTAEPFGTAIHINKRPWNAKENQAIRGIFKLYFGKQLDPLFRASFDGADLNNGITDFYLPSPSHSSDDRISTVYFRLHSDIDSSDMLPVSATLIHGGLDISHWYVRDYYYNNQGPFPTAESLMDAYEDGELELIVFPKGYHDKLKEMRTYKQNTTLPPRPLSNLIPPRSYEPQGPRYTITDHTVEWMGWSFDVSSNMIYGPSLYNIKYKDERIAYEISFNDLTLLYSSANVGAGFESAAFADTAYNIGSHLEAHPGLDCPEHMTSLSSTYWSDEGPRSSVAVCLFEEAGEDALWRHMSKKGAGLRNNRLIVRFPLVMGNYDYSTEFSFHLDGRIIVSASSSGSLYTAFWNVSDPLKDPNMSRTPFGYRVEENNFGPIHDHMFAFKVDLDILDEENRFESIHWKADKISNIFKERNVNVSKDYLRRFPFEYSRYLEYKTAEHETVLLVDSRNPAAWTVYNNKKENRLGSKRGYRITTSSKWQEVLPQDHPFYQGFSHRKYHCAVTKYKDSEAYAGTSTYNERFVTEPVQTLDQYIDGENIIDDDIVLWLSLHFFHIPTAEDFPVTSLVKRSFELKPHNFFSSSEVFDMPEVYRTDEGDIYHPYTVPRCYENVPSRTPNSRRSHSDSLKSYD